MPRFRSIALAASLVGVLCVVAAGAAEARGHGHGHGHHGKGHAGSQRHHAWFMVR